MCDPVEGFLARSVHQLRQRLLVDLMETIGELRVWVTMRGEARPIGFAQGADQPVAVLAGNSAILVAVAIVEAGRCDRIRCNSPGPDHPARDRGDARRTRVASRDHCSLSVLIENDGLGSSVNC